jgi:hypothetical protein
MSESSSDGFEYFENDLESPFESTLSASLSIGPMVIRDPANENGSSAKSSYPVQRTFYAISATPQCQSLGRFAPTNPRCHPNRTKKGEGPESRQRATDRWDNYQANRGVSFSRLGQLGHPGITLAQLQKLCDKIAVFMRTRNIVLTGRNRWAKRRKPNAFHWLDENWGKISSIFDQIVLYIVSEI